MMESSGDDDHIVPHQVNKTNFRPQQMYYQPDNPIQRALSEPAIALPTDECHHSHCIRSAISCPSINFHHHNHHQQLSLPQPTAKKSFLSKLQPSNLFNASVLKRIWRSGNSISAATPETCSSKHRTSISMFLEQNPDSSCSSLSSSGDFLFPSRSHSPLPGRLSPNCSSSSPKKCNWTSVLSQRFPITKAQMERRLRELLKSQSDILGGSSKQLKDASARFGHIQLLELAKDCLRRSEVSNNESCLRLRQSWTEASCPKLTKTYFANLQDKLQRLVDECETKILSVDAFQTLRASVTDFQLAVSRTASLVECLDQNPEQLYRTTLDIAQNKSALARYISGQLVDTTSSVESREQTPEKVASIADLRMPSQKDFRIIKTLTSGAYGSVFLVEHERSKRLMAMKKMSKSFLRLKNVVQQVLTERDILSFTSNPFVVSMFCSFETGHHLYLIMEYVEGGDVRQLLDRLQTYTLPLDLATIYFAETSLALEYVHSFGIIHRDLKPSNLLLTASGHVKLSDFGLSKVGLMSVAASDDEQTFDDKQVLGSPQYMAPEIILRKPYGRAVDWWSMGIIFYEMLVGITPFAGNTVDDLFTSIIYDPVEWPDDFEHELARDLILQLLRRSPELRLTSVRNHGLFRNFDWDHILLRKADTPKLEIAPIDRDEDEFDSVSDSGDDDDDDDEFEFSFSSCSSEYLNLHNNPPPQKPKLKNCLSTPPPMTTATKTNTTSTHSIRERVRSRLLNRNKSLSISRKRPSLEILCKKRQNRMRLNSTTTTTTKSVTLTRDSGGFGLTITTKRLSPQQSGGRHRHFQHFVLSVVPNSPAEQAQIKPNQIVRSVNGRSVRRKSNRKIVQLLIESRNEIRLQLLETTTTNSAQKNADQN